MLKTEASYLFYALVASGLIACGGGADTPTANSDVLVAEIQSQRPGNHLPGTPSGASTGGPVISSPDQPGGPAVTPPAQPVIPPAAPDGPGQTGPTAGNSAATSDSPLPFDLPSKASLRAAPRVVFAHYFSPMSLSIDNGAPDHDYYMRSYLSIEGENKKYVHGGGKMRDRPLTPQRTLAGGLSRTCPQPEPLSAWGLEDMREEVRRAIACGIDGFTLSFLVAPRQPGETGYATYDYRVCQNAFLMLKAAHEVDPAFKIILRPSMPSLNWSTPSQMADFIALMAADPSTYRLADGRLVVSPFHADFMAQGQVALTQQSAEYWRDFVNIMKARGIRVALVPTFLSYNKTRADIFSATIPSEHLYGFSTWDGRSPGANPEATLKRFTAAASDAKGRGKIWMQPVSVQDYRPKDAGVSHGAYYEAQNSENLRLTWQAALESQAEWVDIVTWNDYSESSAVNPSWKQGHSLFDINTYYLAKYKTGGMNPAIKRDAIYLSHRVHRHELPPPTSLLLPQRFAAVRTTGSSAPRNTVEALTFLVEPRQVTVQIGDAVHSYLAPRGVFAKTFPLQAGTVGATLSYDDGSKRSVLSLHPVSESIERQDLTYYFTSSGRTGVTAVVN